MRRIAGSRAMFLLLLGVHGAACADLPVEPPGRAAGPRTTPAPHPTSEPRWVHVAHMPEGRARVGLAEVNGVIYAVGGYSATGVFPSTHRIFAFEPSRDIWSTVGVMDEPVGHAGVAAVNGVVYIVSAIERDGTLEFYSFHPATREVRNEPPLTSINQLAAVAALDNRLHVIGRFRDGDFDTDDFRHAVFDPGTGSWSELSGGKAWVVIQTLVATRGRLYAYVWHPFEARTLEYNPGADQWQTIDERKLQDNWGVRSAVAHSGKLFYFGSVLAGCCHASPAAEAFDLDSRRWEPLPPSSGAQYWPTAVRAGGAIFLVGGWTGYPLSSASSLTERLRL